MTYSERIRAPKKKLITLDQVLKKQETDEEDGIQKRKIAILATLIK